MKSLLCVILLGCFLLLLSIGCAVGPLVYSQDAIEARVVDRETKEPLEGVGVLAVWYLYDGLAADTNEMLRYDDAVTDKDGRFRLEKWGPLLRNPRYRLETFDPEIFLVKSGYLKISLNNNSVSSVDEKQERYEIKPPGQGDAETRSLHWTIDSYSKKSKRPCYWNGKTIGLERAATSKAEADALSFNTPYLQNRVGPDIAPKFWNAYVDAFNRLPEGDKYWHGLPSVADPRWQKRKKK